MHDPDAARLLGVNHPTIPDLDEQINDLRTEISEISENPSFKKSKKMVEEGLGEMMPRSEQKTYRVVQSEIEDLSHFCKGLERLRAAKGYVLGFVAAASGARSTSGTRTCADWALVEVRPERMSDNTVCLPESA